MPIRVTVRRDICIGCGVAPSLCPDIFILEDGRNRVVDRFSMETNDNISVGKLPEDMLDCIENAVTSCPVGAISYERT